MFAQLIFDLLLSSKGNKGITFKILVVLRKSILLFSDPIIKFRYHQFTLKIPFSHDLPLNMKLHPAYNINLGKIAKIVQQKYKDLKIIDVGANIGDSVAVICKEVEVPVLCIEGNPKFLNLLEQNIKQFKNTKVEPSYIGEKSIKVTAKNNLGTAYLEESIDGTLVRTMMEVLTDHPEFMKAKLLKIDTDGFDTKIIRSSEGYIQNTKPVIFFEYDPFFLKKQHEKGIDIYSFLVQLGYTRFIIYTNIGVYLTTINQNDEEGFEELHNRFDKKGSEYIDICALHETDADLTL